MFVTAIQTQTLIAKTIKSTATTQTVAPATTKSPETESEPPSSQKALIVDKAAFVFIRATSDSYEKAIEELKKRYPDDDATAEIASDVGYYAMQVSDFATRKKIAVIETNQPEVIFKKKDGTEFPVKNRIDHIGQEIYIFDGIKNPQLIKDQATFDDGKEFQRYFGGATLKSK